MNENSHLSSQFDQDLSRLRSNVLQMGGLVETQISAAIDAYSKGEVATVKQIVETDRKVNDLEKAIEDDPKLASLRAHPEFAKAMGY